MGFKLACEDLGLNCPMVTHGETVEEVMKEGAQHGKQVHGYTEEQLNDPEMMRKMKEAVKPE